MAERVITRAPKKVYLPPPHIPLENGRSQRGNSDARKSQAREQTENSTQALAIKREKESL